jgi:hypothetical protein
VRRGAKRRRGGPGCSSSRRSGAEGDGSESAMARGGAKVCELRDSKIEGSRGSIYGLNLVSRSNFS